MEGDGMTVEEAVALQADNLKLFTQRYKEGVEIFTKSAHTEGLGPDFCHCRDTNYQNY